ncbi:GDSL-type esterase/lipase family protein [Lacticaseibacillus kribbianus]|uniref:GDSL-type esterase/lipase family protein n=1 Tax=Lacticaseibacillus kribbianus TaxID=2926292 RepID=UPI001CD24D97|nr:GDSL-type esterase/lipase family protein [Lacticaseibacillus kribbianus]
MQYLDMDLHNVARVIPSDHGVLLDRVDAATFAKLDEPATHTSNNASGIELRFVMTTDTVRITLQAQEAEELQVAYVMHGCFAGTYQEANLLVHTTPTTLTIHRPANLPRLQEVAEALGQPFDPAVVRVCLPYCRNWLIGVAGGLRPPRPSEVPSLTYLAYGSSITHGTLALTPMTTYAQQTAAKLRADLLNFGFPGSAWLEPGLADALCARPDWDFATLAMGINMLGGFSVDDFRARVRRFIAPFAKDSRPVLAFDMVATDYPLDQAKVGQFRAVVKEECAGKLPYISGLTLLPDLSGLSADLLHPSIGGMTTIAANLATQLRPLLRGRE